MHMQISLITGNYKDKKQNITIMEAIIQSQIQEEPQSVMVVRGLPEEDDLPDYGSIIDKIGIVQDKKIKPDALEYDIKLGWIPRSQITGPIPISFAHEILDLVIQQKMRWMVYLGYRPATTFQLHGAFYNQGKNYPFYQFHLCKSLFLQRFFKKYYSQYEFQSKRKAQMTGECPLVFDSFFESGNLDAVYYQEGEYRLLLRVDSNTLGHCSYFNFKVKASSAGTYTFRIMNINRFKSLYQRGMRPYVKKIGVNGEWEQSGDQIRFGESPLNQQFEFGYPIQSLKFQFTFPQDESSFQLCYSIPFTYSELIKSINEFGSTPYLHIGKLCFSLSGVQVPLITVSKTRKQENEGKRLADPYVVVITGRAHPSEATGSHIINGALRWLAGDSKQAQSLRVIFKVVPMLNPDGVIMGNTRTSFTGKDLNRRYTKETQFVFPEIIGIRDYVSKLKERYKDKLLFVIDIHGHSARKNSFFYGPQYSIIDEEYAKCRLLPKLYAARTDIFRYYSCKFKVAGYKQTTARGYFNSVGIRTYTHETSAHCFFNFQKRKDEPFTRKKLHRLGQDLVLSIYDYINTTYKDIKNLLPRQEKPLRIKGVNCDAQNEQQIDSDNLSSNKADSENSVEDLQQKKLLQFYKRIDQNKEYFYQELIAVHNLKQQKKKTREKKEKQKKMETPKIEEVKSETRKERNEGEGKKMERIDWASKVNYPERKKKFQQYGKLSNVFFGSSNQLQREQEELLYNRNKQPDYYDNFVSTKYSIKNLDAKFHNSSTKQHSPQHKTVKSLKFIKNEADKRETLKTEKDFSDDPAFEKRKQDRYLQLKEDQQARASKIVQITTGDMQRLLSKPSQFQLLRCLPVYAIDLGGVTSQKQREQREMMVLNKSMKVLTRKKSIKSIKKDAQIVTRQISKSLKNNTLTKKLPSIGSLYHNF